MCPNLTTASGRLSFAMHLAKRRRGVSDGRRGRGSNRGGGVGVGVPVAVMGPAPAVIAVPIAAAPAIPVIAPTAEGVEFAALVIRLPAVIAVAPDVAGQLPLLVADPVAAAVSLCGSGGERDAA